MSELVIGSLVLTLDEDGQRATDQYGRRHRRLPDSEGYVTLRGCWVTAPDADDETDTTEDEFDAMWREGTRFTEQGDA